MTVDPKKIGAWASALTGVAGIVWAVVKAVLWAGALTTSIHDSAQDIASMKTMVHQISEDQRAQGAQGDRLREQVSQELRFASSERASTAAALEALKAEVRVRAERSSAAEVRRASRHADNSISMAAEASRMSADSTPLVTF